MKRCRKCSFENRAMIDYCWNCGSQLANAPNAGNYYQSAQPTAAFQTETLTRYRYQAQDFSTCQNTYTPKPQASAKPLNYGRIAVTIGTIFVFLLMFLGVGAAVAFKVFLRPPVKPYVRQEPYRTNPEPVKANPPTKETRKTVTSNTASAEFEKIWVDYNVKENGRLGMRIHAKFTVSNLKGVDSYLAVYFEKNDGTKLKTSNRKFASKDGQVAVYRSMKPAYDETIYKDLDVFMPYDELRLSRGKYDLKMDADVIYENGDVVEHLNYYEFQYEKFRE